MSVNPRIQRYVPSQHERQEPSRKRCPDCGLHIRGKNHKDGTDHERGVSRRSKK